MRPLADVLAALPTAPDAGLTAAAVAASRARFGANRLTPLPRTPAWRAFVAKFDEPIIKVLLAASLLKTVVDLFGGGGPTVGTAALAAVALVVIAGLILRPLRPWLPVLLFA